MTRPPYAWVLNLDAEHELEAAPAGGHYQPTAHLRAIVARERQRLIGQLVGPGDVLVTEEALAATPRGAAPMAAGLPGFAWSPTPCAIAMLEAAGARPVPSPSVEILRRVNARPFTAPLRAPHAEGSFQKHVETHIESTLARLATPSPDGWLVRRPFGAAGRGRRRLAAGKPSSADLSWLEAGLRRGPLTLEPWVRITCEYTRSGWVGANGEIVISAPCFQETTPEGSWTQTDPAARDELHREDDARLAQMTQTAGEALASAGYFGPFGIDAFRHRRPGRTDDVLNPMSEINARFTMDWVTAFPERVIEIDGAVPGSLSR